MRTQTQQIETLKTVPLFSDLSKSDLKFVLKQMEPESFPPGKDIISENQPGGRFFVIIDGTVKVVAGGKARRTLGPGSYFGELALLDGGGRTATITAVTQVNALSLTSWNFLSTLQENWPVARKIMVGMARRIREMDKSSG